MAGSKKPVKVFKKPTVAKNAVAAKKSTPRKGPSVKKTPAKKVASEESVAKETSLKVMCAISYPAVSNSPFQGYQSKCSKLSVQKVIML